MLLTEVDELEFKTFENSGSNIDLDFDNVVAGL